MKFIKANSEMLSMILLIVLLVGLCIFCSWYGKREIKDALLQEKYTEIVNIVNMLAVVTNGDDEEILIKAAEFIDEINQIYGAVYKVTNGELMILTARNFETSIFDPLDYADFIDAISGQDKGGAVIGYTPENQSFREMHIYFRWMAGKYLIVAGASEHSVTTKVNGWTFAGQAASASVIFIFAAVISFMIPRAKKKGGGI